jgi:hypothetical protein
MGIIYHVIAAAFHQQSAIEILRTYRSIEDGRRKRGKGDDETIAVAQRIRCEPVLKMGVKGGAIDDREEKGKGNRLRIMRKRGKMVNRRERGFIVVQAAGGAIPDRTGLNGLRNGLQVVSRRSPQTPLFSTNNAVTESRQPADLRPGSRQRGNPIRLFWVLHSLTEA